MPAPVRVLGHPPFGQRGADMRFDSRWHVLEIVELHVLQHDLHRVAPQLVTTRKEEERKRRRKGGAYVHASSEKGQNLHIILSLCPCLRLTPQRIACLICGRLVHKTIFNFYLIFQPPIIFLFFFHFN